VLGGTPGAVRYAQIVRQWTHDLVYFTPPDILTATERTQLLARAIGVVEGTIEQLVIDDAGHLRGVQMRDDCVIPRDALFVPPRFVSNSSSTASAATPTPTAGSPSTTPAAPASPEFGPPETSSTRAPRSSPPQAPAPRPPSPSTPTWSTTTCATQSRPRPRLPAPTHHERALKGVTMTTPTPSSRPAVAGPPTKHQLALMIWLAVFPTLTVLNLALGDWLSTLTPVVRTFVLATIAVPIVIYGLMPQLHRLRGRLLTRIASS
jgi:hypothetical protein